MLAASQIIFWVVAQPKLSFPLNSQIPPVAVANKSFNFTFSPDTFSSISRIFYKLEKAPTWLHLDGSARTLFGMPSQQDVGDIHVRITAIDATGSLSQDINLVVLEQSLLRANENVLVQKISRTGHYSAPLTLLLYPQQSFALNFGPEVFSADKVGMQYYVQSAGRTPLPAWISFDADAISLSGTTPSLLTPQSSPQRFGFTLAASRVLGFSQAALDFEISVTNHILAFLNPFQNISGTAGDKIFVPPLTYGLQRDGKLLPLSAMKHSSSNQPDWLTLNEADLSLSGTIPSNSNGTSFKISVSDEMQNVATAQIQIIVNNRDPDLLLNVDLGLVYASIGVFFTYTFHTTDVANATYEIDLDPKAAWLWLFFNASNTTLFGTVPLNTTEVIINVSMTVQDNEETIRVEHLIISLQQANNGSDVAGPVPTTANSSTAENPEDMPSLSKTPKLVFIIIFPVLTGIAVFITIVFLTRRSCARRVGTNLTMTSMMETNISQDHSRNSQSSSGNIVVVTEGSQILEADSIEHGTTAPPPRLDLSWNIRTRPQNKCFLANDCYGQDTPTTRSSWEAMLLEVEGSNIGKETHSLERTSSVQASIQEMRDNDVLQSKSSTKQQHAPMEGSSNETHMQNLGDIRGIRVPLKISAFPGKRKSGICHGIDTGETRSGLDMIPRTVALAPLAQTPFKRNSSIYAQFEPKHTAVSNTQTRFKRKWQEEHTLARRGSYGRSPTIVSNESRFDSPSSDSALQRYIDHGKDAQFERDSNSEWEDDDWKTESSVIPSSSFHLSQREVQEQVLPFPVNSDVSLKETESEQSQTNSLRFL